MIALYQEISTQSDYARIQGCGLTIIICVWIANNRLLNAALYYFLKETCAPHCQISY